MRIGFHGLLIHPSRRGGAEAYARRLLAELQQLDGDDDYFVLTAADADLELTHPRFQHIRCRVNAADPYGRVWWEQTALAGILRKLKLDVVHFPGSTAPWSYRGPSVVTIHETLRFQLPRHTPYLLGAYYGWNQRRIAKSGKHVIAVSRYDASVMTEHLKLRDDQWSVTPLGVDERFQPPTENVPRDYLLWVGRPYAHKNVPTLLQAYALLAGRMNAPPLRLVGLNSREQADITRIAAAHGIDEKVLTEPPRPHETLPALYQGASLFCFPSLFESFGLPIAEALACEIPVVCSDLPAFRELFGGTVKTFNANSPDAAGELAAAMECVLIDETERRRLQARGLEVARKYSWRTCAEQTQAIYHAVAAKGRAVAHA